MIKEVELVREVGTPVSEAELLTVVYGLNACIRQVNALCEIVDRKYATKRHGDVLREGVDPNVVDSP